MDNLDLVIEIERYCVRKGLKPSETTVDELIAEMVNEDFSE